MAPVKYLVALVDHDEGKTPKKNDPSQQSAM